MGSTLAHVTKNVCTSSMLALAANNERRVLIINNKHASQTVRLKFGAALLAAVTEIQKISFSHVPIAGTYKVLWNGNKTTAIDYNDDANAVQAHLRSVTGLDAVTVTGDTTNGFVVTMTGALPNETGDLDLLAITDVTLTYLGDIEVQKITVTSTPTNGTYILNYGGESTSALNYNDNAATIQAALRGLTGLGSVDVAGSWATAFTVTMTGVVGDVAMMTITANSLNIPAVTEVQTVSFSGTPTHGTFKLSYGGNTTSALPYTATSGDIQTALRLLTGLGSVTVSGSFAAGFVVTMTGTSGNIALMTTSENSLDILAVVEQQTLTFEAVPTAGTYKLTYGALKTAALNYNADAAAVQAALRLLTGLGSVTVAGTLATALTVTFTGVSGDATLLGIAESTLSIPAVTEIQTVTFDNTPTSGAFKLNYGGEATGALAYSATASDIQTALRLLTGLGSVLVVGTFAGGFSVTMVGLTGDVAALTVTDNTLERLAVVETQTISVSSIPTNGTYKLNYNGEATSALPYNATNSDIQTALRLLTGLGSVTVAGSFATQFTVTFTGVVGDAYPLTVSNNSLNIPATIEQQTLTFSAVPDAGAFRVSYNGNETGLMNENCTNAILQAALRLLPGLGSVTVAGSFATLFTVTFTGVSGDALMLVEVDNDLENTGTAVTITIAETVKGVAIVNITPTITETLKGVTQANTTPTVTEGVKGVTVNAVIDVTPAETVKGVAYAVVTPTVTETTPGALINSITPVVSEFVKGTTPVDTPTVSETTKGVLADGFVLAAGGRIDFLDEVNCPIDAIYMLASGNNTPVEIVHG